MEGIVDILYAGNPKRFVQQLCSNAENFNKDTLLSIAEKQNIPIPANASKVELCIIIQRSIGRVGFFESVKNAYVATLQQTLAFISSSKYLKSMVNEIIEDLNNPMFQYVMVTDVGKIDKKVLTSMSTNLPYKTASLYITLQQIKTKYNYHLSVLCMMQYGVHWSIGNLLNGSNPPFLFRSNIKLNLVSALRTKFDNLLQNVETAYNLLADDVNTHQWLNRMEADRHHNQKTLMHAATIAAIEGLKTFEPKKK